MMRISAAGIISWLLTVAAVVCYCPLNMSKRITVRLPDEAVTKLEKIAKKITPKGNKPNPAIAVRNLIEKEKL